MFKKNNKLYFIEVLHVSTLSADHQTNKNRPKKLGCIQTLSSHGMTLSFINSLYFVNCTHLRQN